MLTKRITGLAAIVAAFMAFNFAAGTEAKASTLNSTFDYSDSMRTSAPARVVAHQVKRQNAAPVQRIASLEVLPQQPAKTQKFSAYRHPVKASVLPQQQKPVYRASNHRITQNVLDELAKTNSSLHARIVAANAKNMTLYVTPAEAQIIFALAAKSDMQLAAAGDAAVWATVLSIVVTVVLPQLFPTKKDEDGKPVDNPIVKVITAVICLVPIILSKGAPDSLPAFCKFGA